MRKERFRSEAQYQAVVAESEASQEKAEKYEEALVQIHMALSGSTGDALKRICDAIEITDKALEDK